jgi:hypothetical protein
MFNTVGQVTFSDATSSFRLPNGVRAFNRDPPSTFHTVIRTFSAVCAFSGLAPAIKAGVWAGVWVSSDGVTYSPRFQLRLGTYSGGPMCMELGNSTTNANVDVPVGTTFVVVFYADGGDNPSGSVMLPISLFKAHFDLSAAT